MRYVAMMIGTETPCGISYPTRHTVAGRCLGLTAVSGSRWNTTGPRWTIWPPGLPSARGWQG